MKRSDLKDDNNDDDGVWFTKSTPLFFSEIGFKYKHSVENSMVNSGDEPH